MEAVKVLSKGQIVIPASIRKKYNLQPGSEIDILDYGNTIYLIPASSDPIKDAMGCLPKTPSLAKELIKERNKDFTP